MHTAALASAAVVGKEEAAAVEEVPSGVDKVGGVAATARIAVAEDQLELLAAAPVWCLLVLHGVVPQRVSLPVL